MRPSQVHLKHIYTFDFETTGERNIIEGDDTVRVWLWSLVNCETLDSWYGIDIDSFIDTIKRLNVKLAFAHNLRFDGSFIVWYCLKHAIPTEQIIDGHNKSWFSFKTMGVEFRDTLKKFPMSLQTLAHVLGIGGKFQAPDFNRYIPKGYWPDISEIRYCVGDATIAAHAVREEYFADRMRLTASSEAYHALRETIPKFDKVFPPLSMFEDTFVRRSYGGGVCYLKPEHVGETLEGVRVYDINSSYPAQMHDKPLPYKYGYWEEPKRDQLFVVEFTSEFCLKDKHIPSLLAARHLQYAAKSDNFILESDGPTTLCMTSVDYDLFHKQYDVDYEIDHRWVSYESKIGICAPFIDQEMDGKNRAKTPHERQKHKLNMNMAYGSFGINPNTWKVNFALDENIVKYDIQPDTRMARYSVLASFITAWGRHQLVTAAQRNYDSFIYSDTDSIHLLKPAKGIDIDPKRLGAWKPECWPGYDEYPHAKYLRPKAYAHADESKNIFKEQLPDGRWNIEMKCAGIPERSKIGIGWDDFRLGHLVRDKLQQCMVPGGACLLSTTYTI